MKHDSEEMHPGSITTALLLVVALSATSFAVELPRDELSLDGPWRVAFDPDNVGVNRDWRRPHVLNPLATRVIPVPSCWEEHEEDYEGVAWYTRQVEVPAAWKGKYVRLQFDAVNYLAEVWVNGEMVGSKESGFTPIAFDVTPFLKYGHTNQLSVRVVGAAVRTERVAQFVANEVPAWRGAYLGGIWQSVRLVATNPVFVKDLFIEPHIQKNSATANIELANETFQPLPVVGATAPLSKDRGPDLLPCTIQSHTVDVEVSIASQQTPNRPVATTTLNVTLPPGMAEIATELKIADPVLWSLDDPHLYVATVRLHAAKGTGPSRSKPSPGRSSQLASSPSLLDSKSVRFGMRDFTIKDKDFYLNGERVFIKGAFWEGLYPSTLGHPRDPEIVRKEIRMAKEAGLNLLRPWRMPPAPMIVEIADEMGMLMVGSPAVACMGYWLAETPNMEERWTRAFTEMIRRDRNHPSIVMWETTNEIVRKSMLVRRHRVSLAGRALDPTRVIIDESGGARSVWGSFAYLPYSREPMQFADRHLYYRAPVNARVYDSLQNYDAEGQLVFISEIGYGSFPDIASNVARYRKEGNPKTPDFKYHVELLETLETLMERHQLSEVFPDVTALCDSTQEIQALGNKLQLEALRLNPAADGYCIHAFTDGDWVVGAGVLDLWREPKKLYYTMKEVQQPLYLGIRVAPGNVYASRGARLCVVAANDGQQVSGRLEVTVAASDGRAVWSKSTDAVVAEQVSALLEHALDTSALTGKYTASVRLIDGKQILAKNAFEFLVFQDADVKPMAGNIVLIDRQRKLANYFDSHGTVGKRFAGNATSPVLVAPNDAWLEREAATFVRLLDWVGRGGVAVWLDPPSTYESTGQPIYEDDELNFMKRFYGRKRRPAGPWPNFLIEAGIFPKHLRYRGAAGMWIPVGHYARKHPIFAGAEVDGFMNWPWQNVAARKTLVNLNVPSIAGAVSWESFHDYRAVTKAWHGIDVGVMPHGKGKMILSTLDILPHLGKDPLADKMLNNLLSYAKSLQGSIDPPNDALVGEIKQRTAKFLQLKADWDAKVKALEAQPWP